MKKILSYLIIVLIDGQVANASCTIESALKQSSAEPNYISVIGALLLVVLMIYVTGIIYTKLNVLGSKVVKQSRKNLEEDKVFILSTTQLPNNKALPVVEVNGEKLLIGVSQNGISLLKELKKSLPKYEKIEVEEMEKDDLNEVFPKEEVEEVQEDEDFGLYKKYL